MPFINYAVGDLAVAGPPCACGRGLPLILAVAGRVGEILQLPGGTGVPAFTVEAYMRVHSDVRTVREFQVVQTAVDRVLLRLVTTPAATSREPEDLRKGLASLLGPEVTVGRGRGRRDPAGAVGQAARREGRGAGVTLASPRTAGGRAAAYGWFVPPGRPPAGRPRARAANGGAPPTAPRVPVALGRRARGSGRGAAPPSCSQHARPTCPFYRRLLGDAGIRPEAMRSLDDLSRVPVATRAALKEAGLESTTAEQSAEPTAAGP